jgi:folylpolyglutamate synthase/dihydropteroate synthase
VTDFVITHIPGERGANLTEIGSVFAGYVENAPWKIHTYEKLEDAVKYGMGLKGDNGVMYVVGSLYLAGLVEEILTDISVVEENYDKF